MGIRVLGGCGDSTSVGVSFGLSVSPSEREGVGSGAQRGSAAPMGWGVVGRSLLSWARLSPAPPLPRVPGGTST